MVNNSTNVNKANILMVNNFTNVNKANKVMVNNSTNVNKVNKSPLTYSLNLKKIIMQGQHREIYPINTLNVESFPFLDCNAVSKVMFCERKRTCSPPVQLGLF
jgi:hypothetical protein